MGLRHGAGFWLTVLCLVACTEARVEWSGRVTLIDGVYRVDNPTEPLADAGAISTTLRWTRSGPDAGDIWEAPNKLHVFRDRIYVVDRRASKIHLLTTDGASQPSLGEPGAGPGQYRRIADAIPTPVGLFVVDQGNSRIEVLTASGEPLASHHLGQAAFAAAPLGPNAIVVFGVLGREQGWTKIDADGNREPLEFPDFEPPDGHDGSISAASTWGERLVRLRQTSPQIRVYSTAGSLETVIDLPLPVEETSDEEIEDIVRDVSSVLARDGVPAGVIQQQVDRIRSRPRAKRRFRKIVFDDDGGLGAIWEQDPEGLGSGNASLHLFSIDGIYLTAIRFDRPWADFAVSDGVLYVLARDPDTDLVTLMAFELNVPPELLERARQVARASHP